jgi:hypothetical protein
VKIPSPTPPAPNALVRATFSWDGPALMRLIIEDAEGRQAASYNDGNSNEIPDTVFTGEGGPGPHTDTFTDNLFYGTYGAIPFPNPGNRNFSFTTCYDGSAGPEPTGCATWIN